MDRKKAISLGYGQKKAIPIWTEKKRFPYGQKKSDSHMDRKKSNCTMDRKRSNVPMDRKQAIPLPLGPNPTVDIHERAGPGIEPTAFSLQVVCSTARPSRTVILKIQSS